MRILCHAPSLANLAACTPQGCRPQPAIAQPPRPNEPPPTHTARKIQNAMAQHRTRSRSSDDNDGTHEEASSHSCVRDNGWVCIIDPRSEWCRGSGPYLLDVHQKWAGMDDPEMTRLPERVGINE